MKPERAQELYSEYAEGALTPALRQALEQHFEADPAARADYDQFSQLYALLEQPLGQELEAPLGFRAKILERVSEQQVQRETTFSSRAAGLFGGWFAPPAHRRATGGALAALAVVVVGGILVTHPSGPGTVNGTFGPLSGTSAVTGIVQSVDMQSGTNYHLFHLHLPTGVTAATVNAYVITATEQITDPTHLSEATPAVTGQHLSSHEALQIPIAPVDAPPAGSTLNLLTQYKPDSASESAGAEAVFTPFGAADPATPAPANANFLDGMQAVAAHYGSTVIVDVTASPTQAVTADFSGGDAIVPLKSMAASANYTVRKTADNTYYVFPAP
ncbi:MAG: anti-sigma factor family protein [Janthinobacterium lividum]